MVFVLWLRLVCLKKSLMFLWSCEVGIMKLEILSNTAQCHNQLFILPLNDSRTGPAIACVLYVNSDGVGFSFLRALTLISSVSFPAPQDDITNVKGSVALDSMPSKTMCLYCFLSN